MILPMGTPRSGLSCMAYNLEIHAIGGFNGTSRMTSGEKFDPERNTWTTLPDMRTPRSNSGIEVVNDQLLAIGGFTGSSAESTTEVEAYDFVTDEWHNTSETTIKRSAFATILMSGLPMSAVRNYVLPRVSKPVGIVWKPTTSNNNKETDIEGNDRVQEAVKK